MPNGGCSVIVRDESLRWRQCGIVAPVSEGTRSVNLFRNIAAGTVGGLAGGIAMYIARTIGIEGDIIQATLPDKYEQAIDRRLGFAHQTDDREEKQLTVLEHLMMSAGLGVIYGLIRGMFHPRSLPAAIAYSAVVYLAMVGGAGPLLGATRAPWSKPAKNAAGELMSHILFGSVMALVASRIEE